MEEILKNVKVSNDQHHDLNVKEMIEGCYYINLLRRLSMGFTLIIVLKGASKLNDEMSKPE